MNCLTKARKLMDCGFRVYGLGNFDITVKELARILELVDKEDFKSIKELYSLLAEERL